MVWRTMIGAVLAVWSAARPTPLHTQASPGDLWSRADAATHRLAPSAFGDLPAPLEKELRRRGCTVPQVHGAASPHNVIRGRFGPSGGPHWAVLCSRHRVSAIVIFWDEEGSRSSEMAARPDAAFLQEVVPGRLGFSREIRAVSPARIREQHARESGPALPPLDHDGIEDAFVEKASVIWYWRQGRWVPLLGAD